MATFVVRLGEISLTITGFHPDFQYLAPSVSCVISKVNTLFF